MPHDKNLENKPGSNRALSRSSASSLVKQTDFAKVIACLCVLKRTADFTDAWYNGLGTFPIWIINRAVLKLATSQDRFPEFGDVYQLCRREAIRAGLLTEPATRTVIENPTVT